MGNSSSINPTKIVNGTAGNDVLSIPAGTQLVNGDGGDDIVSFGPYQYYAGYQIVRNSDGSISVSDVHGGSITNTQMVGITTLQFTDGYYTVATGAFTPGTAPIPQPTIDPTKIVNGTTGNDVLTVPAGTLLVNGDGGTDTVSFGPYQYYSGYQITRNSDGSVSVTDVHGGSLTNTEMVGITTLQFTDGTYNVATGQFTAGATAAATSAATTTTTSTPTTTISAPAAIDPTKIVNGTSGNDVLTIPAGTQQVNGDGGNDIVSFGSYQYYANYQITRNSDGSISVTDVHGGSITDAKMVGITTLQFTDGYYTVATGAFTAGTAPIPQPTIDPTKVVTGTTGNDVLTVPAGTLLVNGDGGTDTVSFGAYQYYAEYQITRNSDGSVSVTDVHGGSITDTKMVGIATLQFADGAYNVATGQFTAGAPAAATTTATTTSTPTTAISAPAAVDPTKIVNGTSGNDVLTVPAGTQEVNGDGGNDIVSFGPYQYYSSYEIARNSDGSISVTDVHGGSITDAKMVGISTLQFTDGYYTVATGAFTAGTAPIPQPTIDPTKVVTGTTGNDVLTVPAGTLLVNGDGGTDTVSFGPYQYYAEYQITRNSDGSVSVTDVHGGSITDTKMVGITTLQFTDGSYNVATGQFTAGAAPAVSTTTTSSTSTTTSSSQAAVDPTKIVNGTSGNDVLTVPAGTQEVNGDGGNDIVSFGAYQYYAGYQIARNSDGSISVTDVHGGSITDTKMVGIATLQFSDGYYNVSTGAFTAGIAPTPISLPSVDPTKVVTGTPGNDVLTVPAGTLLVNGDGGTDTVSLGAYQYYAEYQITRNTDGSISVTDVHGGSITNTEMVGISTLQFADGTYNVATGQFTAGAAAASSTTTTSTTTSASSTSSDTSTVTTESSGGSTAGGNYTIPAIAQPQASGDIVAVHLENNTSAAIASRVVTFGQVFAEGDVPAGTHLVATIGGQQVAVQMDVKTTNADGSVADAVLSVQAPSIAANGAVDVMLSRGTGVATGNALDPHSFVADGYDEQVALTFHNADGSTSVQHIDVGAALTQALAAGTATSWLNGPLASEVRISVPVNGAVTAQFDVRANADGTFSTDVAIQNDGVFSSASQSYDYDIAITSHGQSLYSQTNVQQAPMQEWEHTVWSNGQGAAQAPQDYVAYDVAYLEKTGAVAGYDTSIGVSSAAISTEQASLNSTNTAPLGSDLVTQYEPTTGARPDIGPTTQWAADWLTSQFQAADQIMLDNASAASSEPIHALNADGSLVTVANDPSLWLDYRGSEGMTENFATIESQSGWTPDTAHMPDLTYLAALSTGSEYALDQLQAQANYDLLSMAPGYRPDDSSMIGAQERGIAWTIRDVANAAYLTPDSDPLKGYFTQQLDSIITNLDTTYVHGAAGAAEGNLQGYIMGAFDGSQVAPWEQGYIVVALGQAVAEGFSGAADVLSWMNNFVSGLYLNGANGYNPLDGSGYWLTAGSGSLATGNFQSFTTWQQLFDANFAGQATPTSLFGYPNDPIGGYSTIAKAALATEWNVTHSASDLAAYAFVTQNTPYLIQNAGGYASSETWNITPTLSDGHHLQDSEVYYGNGGTTIASTPNGLLAASSGNNVLQAGNGDSILIGGSGNDTLNGGAGDDYLFAGTGAQTLSGGAGTNYLEGHLNGGSSPDVFVFNVNDTAHDTVVNFQPGFDTLAISGGAAGVTALSLLATATTDAAGDAVLHLSAQHDVVLQGVQVAQIDPHSVHVS